MRVEGEVSGLKRSGPGHLYFCLKDDEASLDCVLFSREAARLKFTLEEGMAVRCRGRLTLYEARGRFQMSVADDRADRARARWRWPSSSSRQRLGAEGLFDPARKRPLPFLPRRLGVVTSPQGAVMRDIIRVAHRRFPVPILLSPTPVQGEGASLAIAAALRRLEAVEDVDVIIVARGGGSLEDLWAFNEEPVARAIVACRVPVISAVGHETDFTIADFVGRPARADAVRRRRAGRSRRARTCAPSWRCCSGAAGARWPSRCAPRGTGSSGCAGASAIRGGCSTSGASASTSRSSAAAACSRRRLGAARAELARLPRCASTARTRTGASSSSAAALAAARHRLEAAIRPALVGAPPRHRGAPAASSRRCRRCACSSAASASPSAPTAAWSPAPRDVAPGERVHVRLRDGAFDATVDAATRDAERQAMIRAAVLGSDVSKSRSPAIHNAAFKALGIDGEYVARSVDAAGFGALVAAAPRRRLPLPQRHHPAQGRRRGARRRAGPGGARLGRRQHAPLRHARGADPRREHRRRRPHRRARRPRRRLSRGKTIVMVGAGGAAAGAAEALTRAGARLRLVARRPEAATRPARLAWWPRSEHRSPSSPGRRSDLRVALAGADVLVSAVPAAAWASDDARAGLDALTRSTAVLEMAYGATTPLADAVRARTDRYADGLGMLVHQAAHAITLALGTKPPLAPLFAAVRDTVVAQRLSPGRRRERGMIPAQWASRRKRKRATPTC